MLQPVLGLTADWALVVLRIAVGAIFFAHGYQKVFQMGPKNFGGWLKSLGIPFPMLLGYVVSYTELLGGLALMAGFLTPVVAVLLAADMVVAIAKVNFKRGLVGGYELDLALLAAAVTVALLGPGLLSLDRVIGLI